MNTVPDHEEYLSGLIIKKISVNGYRNLKKPIEISLKSDANFLIGRNGTGKTTLINLIYDALSVRYQSLWRSPFISIEFIFSHADKRYSPKLTVEKIIDADGLIHKLNYRFRDYKSKDDAFSYSLVGRHFRSADDPASSMAQRKIKEELEKRFSLTWLALNRSSGLQSGPSESDNWRTASDIDRKLSDSVQRLSTYSTRLDSLFAAEVQKFQQQWLMSFMVEEKPELILRRINDLDFEEEKKHLLSMLRELKMPPHEYLPKVDRHISLAKRLASGDAAERNSFSAFITMYEISKLHRWVERWRILQDRKTDIYKYRDKFLKKMNEMLFRKEAELDSGNLLKIFAIDENSAPQGKKDEKQKNRRDIDLRDLSSGEKQLIIFLTETLLREQRPYIFLADEPELSLHIEWQEILVSTILEISPGAQIFFATHSPDIVNRFGDNVFSMEDLV